MNGLIYPVVIVIALVAANINAACWRDSIAPDPASIADSLSADDSPVVPTPSATANPHASAVTLTDLINANCWEGQALAPGDNCTYPGTSDEFRVDAEGKGHFLFFTADAVINVQNANINGQVYDFSAKRQDDGDWVIELAGTSVDVIRVSDLIAPADNSPSSSASAELPVTEEEGLPPASAPKDSVPPEPASTPRPSVAETTSSLEPASGSEPPRYSPARTPTPELASVPAPTSTISIDAESADAMQSIEEASTLRQNRSPQIVENIGDQTVTVDESIVVDVARAFSDADGDELQRYIVILSDTTVASGTADPSIGSLTLTGLRIGSSWVAVKACDHSDCSAPGDLTFRLTVEPPPNHPPQVVGNIENQQVTVGETVSVPVYSAFKDFEGDRIVSYEVELQDGELAKVTKGTSKGTFRLTGLRAGLTTASVSACDFEICGDDASALRFNLEIVAPPDSPPAVTDDHPAVVGSIGNQVISVGEVIQLDTSLYFDDPDGEQIRDYQFWQTESGIADGTIDSNRGILNIKGVAVGATRITVNANDGNSMSETSSLSFNLEVTNPSPDIPRVVGIVPDQTVELGDSIEVRVARAFDAPSRYRIIRYDFLVNDREVAANSEITRDGVLTLRGSETGRRWVSVRACNHLGCSDFSDLSFVLEVTE